MLPQVWKARSDSRDSGVFPNSYNLNKKMTDAGRNRMSKPTVFEAPQLIRPPARWESSHIGSRPLCPSGARGGRRARLLGSYRPMLGVLPDKRRQIPASSATRPTSAFRFVSNSTIAPFCAVVNVRGQREASLPQPRRFRCARELSLN